MDESERTLDFGTCATEGCGNSAVITCRFQSLAIKEFGPPIKRFEHEVEAAWCWPCFACWTDRLKTNARRGWGAVWASVDNADGGPDDHALVRIDPETNEIVDSLPLPEAGDLAVGEGSVWVLSRAASEGAIIRIDALKGAIAATIPVGDQLSNIAIAEGAVWVTRANDANPPSGEVVRVDPATNEIVAHILVSGGWPRDLVIAPVRHRLSGRRT